LIALPSMAQAASLPQLLTVIAPVWHVVATLIPHLITCRLRVWFSEAQLASASSRLISVQAVAANRRNKAAGAPANAPFSNR
jgi:hypothetical protein